MPYITHMISRPIEPAFAGTEVLGIDYGAAATAGAAIVGSAVNYFGQKEASKQAAAQAKIAEAQAAQAAAMAAQSRGGGGIPTTYLIVGGLAIAGVLVLAMRRK
jgi:hypothetical protein